jgi:signal transduction histidine kinase
VFPAQLARAGLPAALASLLARTGSTQRLVVEKAASGRRFDPRIEAAAYFCVAEAARDLEDPVAVAMNVHDERLSLVVSGNEGGELPLGHMRDRVEAAGGSVSTTCRHGRTVVEIRGPRRQP